MTSGDYRPFKKDSTVQACQDCHAQSDRVALEDQQGFGNGRCAWDLVAVLHAIRPDNRDYYSISGEGDGRCNVDFFGANTWQDGDISGEERRIGG